MIFYPRSLYCIVRLYSAVPLFPHSLPPVSTTLGKLDKKFAAAVFDPGSKFAAGDIETGCHIRIFVFFCTS
jgi:hypothetical protein